MADEAPPEIVAIVAENFDWWNGGEPELMLDSYADEGELDLSAVFTDIPVLRGRAAIASHMNEFWEAWGGLKMESLEVRRVGAGRYVVEMRLSGTGRRSGAQVDQRFAWLYALDEAESRVVRAQLFPTIQAAMDSAVATG